MKTLNRKRLSRGLGYVVAALILLELGLQLASCAVYLTHSRDEVSRGSEGGGTILCIGDSYTYGVGTSSADNTYPAVMGRTLKDRNGVEPTVVNAGWPGQNSRDLLSKLDGQLERFDPDLVLILIGLNDTWSRPKHLELSETPVQSAEPPGSQWHWRWRTARLLAWAFGSTKTTHEPEPTMSASPSSPAGGSNPPANTDSFAHAVACLSAGDAEAAAQAFEAALQTQPERAAEIHQGLIQAYAILGMQDKAEHYLKWLEEDYAREGSLSTTKALVAALAVLRENARAFEIAKAGVAAFPNSSQLWWFLGEGHYRTARLALAEEAYDRALSCAQPGDVPWRAVLMRAVARACAQRDPKKSLKLVISSLLLDGDLGKCLVSLRPGRAHYSPELARESVAQMNLDPASQNAAQRMIAALQAMKDQPTPTNSSGRVLESHLRQLIARCVARGARPILMTYPMSVPHVEGIVINLARETEAELIDVRQRFELAARSQSQEELFVPDGHCADGGYLIIGLAAADAAGKILVAKETEGASP